MAGPRRFVFTTPLVNLAGAGPVYGVAIPERVSSAIGRRGPVPIVALLNKAVEVQASMVPMGGGRHRLQLNARARGELKIALGDPVRVELMVPEKPAAYPMPPDLGEALREIGLLEGFLALPVGKQNHIILWIEEAVRPETREKRVAKVVEMALGHLEQDYDRRKARAARQKV